MSQRQRHFSKGFVNQKGFTLAELILSAGILGVVITGVVMSYIRCLDLNEVSQNKSLATKAARSRLELIKMTPFDNLVATYNAVPFAVTGFTGRGVSYVTVIDQKNVAVRVSVSWRQKNGRMYGEDTNLNGAVNAGEDKNNDGFLTSPVDLLDVIFKRD